MPVEIVERVPEVEDYNRLRTLVGWHVCDPLTVERSLPASWCFLCAVSCVRNNAEMAFRY